MSVWRREDSRERGGEVDEVKRKRGYRYIRQDGRQKDSWLAGNKKAQAGAIKRYNFQHHCCAITSGLYRTFPRATCPSHRLTKLKLKTITRHKVKILHLTDLSRIWSLLVVSGLIKLCILMMSLHMQTIVGFRGQTSSSNGLRTSISVGEPLSSSAFFISPGVDFCLFTSAGTKGEVSNRTTFIFT